MRIERHPIGIDRCDECCDDRRKRRPDFVYHIKAKRWAMALCRKCLRELGRQIRETDNRKR